MFDNYPSWEVRVMAKLVDKDLDEVVEEGVDRKADSGNRTPQKDKKAKALITRYVRDFHLSTVRQADSAKELWDHFEDTYKSKNSSRLMQLLQSLSNIKMLPTDSLTRYFSRARTIQSDLQTAGQDVSDTQVILSVLNGLPKAYSTVVTVLTATGKASDLDSVLPALLQVEQQIKQEEEVPMYMAKARGLAGRHGPNVSSKGNLCWYCKKPGHTKRDCLQRTKDNNQCGETRYTVAF